MGFGTGQTFLIAVFLAGMAPAAVARAAVDVTGVPGRIVLSADRCVDLDADVAQFEAWTARAGGAECRAVPEIQGEGCRIDVTRCVPPKVASLNGRRPIEAGPNCWNLALVQSGILPMLRYTLPDEMSFFMSSPLCRKLEGEKPRAGDIGAYRTEGDRELHGFIHISDHFAFSKNGSDRKQEYAIQSYERMERDNEAGDRSRVHMEYYRCESFDEHLRSFANDENSRLVDLLTRLNDFECLVSDMTFSRSPFPERGLLGIAEVMRSMTSLMASDPGARSSSSDVNEEEAFLAKALNLRLNSVAAQIDFFLHKGTPAANRQKLQTVTGQIRSFQDELYRKYPVIRALTSRKPVIVEECPGTLQRNG